MDHGTPPLRYLAGDLQISSPTPILSQGCPSLPVFAALRREALGGPAGMAYCRT